MDEQTQKYTDNFWDYMNEIHSLNQKKKWASNWKGVA